AFREIPVALNQADTRKNIAEYSPSGKVPVLLNGPEKIWESLAICEYAAETLKLPAAWPADITLKFQARSLACEMHAGFADLRRAGGSARRCSSRSARRRRRPPPMHRARRRQSRAAPPPTRCRSRRRRRSLRPSRPHRRLPQRRPAVAALPARKW